MATIKSRIAGLSTLTAFIAVMLLTAPLAHAQEEDPRTVTVTAGPHLVRVVPVNTNLAAGFIQMALYVTNAETGEPVSDAKVVFIGKNVVEDYEGWGIALNSPAEPEKYTVRMNLGSTGDWLMSVDVSSSLGQGGGDAMTFDVPALKRYTGGSLVFFGVFAAMMLGIAYIFWSTKRDNRRRREAAQGESQEEPQG